MPKTKKSVTEDEQSTLYGEKILFEWKAAEQAAVLHIAKYRKVVVIGIVLMSLWALFNSNWLFFIILALWGLIMLVIADVKPRIHEFRVTETGLAIDEEMFPYIDIRSFWIRHEVRNKKKLFAFRFVNPMRATLHVPVPAEQAEEIRLAINSYVPQSQEEISMSSLLERLFR